MALSDAVVISSMMVGVAHLILCVLFAYWGDDYWALASARVMVGVALLGFGALLSKGLLS